MLLLFACLDYSCFDLFVVVVFPDSVTCFVLLCFEVCCFGAFASVCCFAM